MYPKSHLLRTEETKRASSASTTGISSIGLQGREVVLNTGNMVVLVVTRFHNLTQDCILTVLMLFFILEYA